MNKSDQKILTPEEIKAFTKKAKLIMEKWSSSLAERDRSKEYVLSNFDELFYDFSCNEIPFDIVHDMISDIAKCHYPSLAVAKNVYKSTEKEKVFNEFFDEWKKGIKDKAHQSFFGFYDIENNKEAMRDKTANLESEKEYRAQRKYADGFPTLTIEDIDRIMNSGKAGDHNG